MEYTMETMLRGSILHQVRAGFDEVKKYSDMFCDEDKTDFLNGGPLPFYG
jgi:hypothetical protein